MTKPKTLEQLRAEKERAETQLAQEQHKLERLEEAYPSFPLALGFHVFRHPSLTTFPEDNFEDPIILLLIVGHPEPSSFNFFFSYGMAVENFLFCQVRLFRFFLICCCRL